MSLIEEGDEKQVRMAYLATVGSHSVNGVAELHSKLLQRDVLNDFAEMYPERFNNKTNGVTPRRWLRMCNPRLASLITEAVGDGWVTDMDKLRGLEKLAGDAAFVEKFRAAKRGNKEDLAGYLRDIMWLSVDPASVFDVQIKRLHEYKRQLLNALHIIHLWVRARQDPSSLKAPRTFLFGAKSAPGYKTAKQIIRLITGISEVVNSEAARTGLRVGFVPNYRVTLAERIIPAADVSEQISTAGMEASGTGNMKFAMNGALTVGTGLLLAGGPRPLQAAGEVAARRRPLPGAGRLRRLRPGPGGGGEGLRRSLPVVALGHRQRGPHGLLLQRPDDRRLREGHLGHHPGAAARSGETRKPCALRT
jgi:starch phosphorylase